MERRSFLTTLFYGAGGFAGGGIAGIASNRLFTSEEGYAKSIRTVVPDATDAQVAALTEKQRNHFASGCASVGGAIAMILK